MKKTRMPQRLLAGVSFVCNPPSGGIYAPGRSPPPAGGGIQTPARRATHCLLPPLPGATGEARAGTAAARDQAKEDHSAGPGKGAAPIPAAGALGGPGQPITAPQAGTGQGRPRAARPTRGGRNAPNDHTAATGGTAKPHGGRPAEPPGPAPRTALSLAGGLRPPRFGRRRKLTGADRRRPTAGPAPHHQAPTTTSHRGPEPGGGRPGQAGQFSCRRIPFGPEDGHKAAARDTPRGDSPGPGRRGGPCGPAWRHGRRGGTE